MLRSIFSVELIDLCHKLTQSRKIPFSSFSSWLLRNFFTLTLKFLCCCCGSSMGRKSHDDTTLNRVLDEDFDCLLRVATCIGESLARPKDREICTRTLQDLAKFNNKSSSITKRHVRKFLCFYLQVLRWTQLHQPLELYEKWVGRSIDLQTDNLLTFNLCSLTLV